MDHNNPVANNLTGATQLAAIPRYPHRYPIVILIIRARKKVYFNYCLESSKF